MVKVGSIPTWSVEKRGSDLAKNQIPESNPMALASVDAEKTARRWTGKRLVKSFV